ncbi:MAG: hypothetical protein ACO34E_15035 [Limisphaerales bacterium]
MERSERNEGSGRETGGRVGRRRKVLRKRRRRGGTIEPNYLSQKQMAAMAVLLLVSVAVFGAGWMFVAGKLAGGIEGSSTEEELYQQRLEQQSQSHPKPFVH